MAKEFIQLQGDVSAFKRFLNPEMWKGNLEANIRKATIRNSLYLIKKIKDRIRNDKYGENSKLTLMLKSSDKTLIDDRNLWNGIDKKLKSSFEAEVGIIVDKKSTGSKLGKNKSQIGLEKLVELMEEGYTIKVTNKMRLAMLAAMEEKSSFERDNVASRGGGLKEGSSIVVPPRKIFTSVWEDPVTEKVIRKNWRVALTRAFTKQGGR